MPDPSFSPECAGWMQNNRGIVAEALAGKKFVYDARTTKCLAEALAYEAAMRPEIRIWAGLPAVYVQLAKEWDDPAQRSALLKRMASSRDIREFFSPHLSIHDNIRLWVARFKVYADAVEKVALHNVVPEPSGGVANVFYERF